MKLQKGFLILFAIIYSSSTFSQNYHALAGSPYAGVEGIFHNPASSVNSAFSWDITLLSGQASFANKAIVAENASFQSLQYGSIDYKQAKVTLTNGSQDRSFNGNADFSILNFRCKLNNKSAFAFGLRGRGFLHAYADPFIYSDTMSSLKSWAAVNKNDPPLSGSIIHSGWLEANFNYSRVYRDNDHERITWGATLSVMKGLSALEFNPRQMTYAEAFNGRNQPYYYINGGNMSYRYSENYDLYDTNQSPRSNVSTILNSSLSSLGLSIGIEYVLKSEYTSTFTSWGGPDWNAKDYDWKFGAAILDIGSNAYNFGKDAAEKNIPTGLVTDTLFNRYNLFKIDKMRDTLLHSYNSSEHYNGHFVIYNPTRLVLNADKNFGNNFYMNGELTINFFSTKAQSIAKTREINFLIITPRWETKGLGIYFPLQLNTEMQCWVGTAVKLGPLVVGLHNIDFFTWFNKGNHQLNGGGYIMLSVHPFGKDKEAADCPRY